MAKGLLMMRTTLRGNRPAVATSARVRSQRRQIVRRRPVTVLPRFRAACAPSMATCTADDVRSEHTDLLKVAPCARVNRSRFGCGGDRTGRRHFGRLRHAPHQSRLNLVESTRY